jgi:hypothetical protein
MQLRTSDDPEISLSSGFGSHHTQPCFGILRHFFAQVAQELSGLGIFIVLLLLHPLILFSQIRAPAPIP